MRLVSNAIARVCISAIWLLKTLVALAASAVVNKWSWMS